MDYHMMTFDILTIIGVAIGFASLGITLFMIARQKSFKGWRKYILPSISFIALLLPACAYYLITTNKKPYGEYQWQWAGENWIGQLYIDPVKTTIDVRKIKKDVIINKDGSISEIFTKSYDPIIKTTKSGTLKGNRYGFLLELPVDKTIVVDDKGHIQHVNQILNADLHPIEAYAGKVKYHYTEASLKKKYGVSTGDMIIVKYDSSF